MGVEPDHLADILIPTHSHAPLLEVTLETAVAQTISDIAIIVVGDGVGDDTRAVVASAMERDHRIRFHDLPKGRRTGESHRHDIVLASSARFVTYLCDDDLLFPDHVERVAAHLGRYDVTMPPNTDVLPGGLVRSSSYTLEGGRGRRLQLAGQSLFGLSGLTHTVDAYRRLPEGWSETPEGYYTDQYMILKFLREPWCRIGRIDEPTTMQFQSVARRGVPMEERRAEMDWSYQWAREQDGWNQFRRRAAGSRRRHQVRTNPVGRLAATFMPAALSQALSGRRSIPSAGGED